MVSIPIASKASPSDHAWNFSRTTRPARWRVVQRVGQCLRFRSLEQRIGALLSRPLQPALQVVLLGRRQGGRVGGEQMPVRDVGEVESDDLVGVVKGELLAEVGRSEKP